MAPEIKLEPIEELALLGAMLGFLKPTDRKKAEIHERDLESGVEILLRALEREDSVLATIEVRGRLREANLLKVLDRFGRVRMSVRAILENRRGRPANGNLQQGLLPAIIDGAATAARRAGLEDHVETVRLAAYCSAIAHGPDLYWLPLDPPAIVMRPLGHVPSVSELRSTEAR